MGETVPLAKATFNSAIRVETRPERLNSDAGVYFQREALERTGIISWLTERLTDPRDPHRVKHLWCSSSSQPWLLLALLLLL